MTCCIGKARIYFREPINYWLTYQLPNGSFGSVTAPEPLTHNCIFVPGEPGQVPGVYYIMSLTSTFYPNGGSSVTKISYSNQHKGPILGLMTSWFYSSSRRQQNTRLKGINIIYIASSHFNYGGFSRAPEMTYTVTRVDGTPPEEDAPSSYTFKVIGTETGTVYREIGGLEECPTVISNTCVMGEERYIDQLLPDQSPGGPVESSCFVLQVDGNNWRVNLVTTFKGIDNKKLRPPETRNVLYLTGLPGCPPEYRVECCGIDQCEPEEQCPPDTDCSLDCGDFVCCYKDGKVIKTIQK